MTVIVTTLIFTLAHIDVSYTPANLVVFAIALVMIGVIGRQQSVGRETLRFGIADEEVVHGNTNCI